MNRKSQLLAAFLFAVASPSPAADLPTCAVLTFSAKDGITEGQAQIFSDRFAAELGNLNAFTMLDRNRIKEILDLQHFSRSDDCSSLECVIEVGKILAVQNIVHGSIGKIGALFTLTTFRTDIESGVTVTNSITDFPGSIEEFLTKGIRCNARRLTGIGCDDETAGMAVVKSLFTISGEVRLPGQYEISENMKLVQALSKAGGLTDFANPNGVEIRRKGSPFRVDFRWIEKHLEDDLLILPDDVIIVPRSLF